MKLVKKNFPLRVLGLAAVLYGGGYLSFRVTKQMVHCVSYNSQEVPSRDHDVLALRYRFPDGSETLFAHASETLFSPARLAEVLFWRVIPRAYPNDDWVLARAADIQPDQRELEEPASE